MTTCREIYTFLSQVSARNVTATLSEADANLLSQLHLVQFLTQPEYLQLQTDVQALGSEQEAIAQEAAQRVGLARNVQEESRGTHSVLFRLEGKQKRAAKLQREADDEARLKAVDTDLAQKQQQFGQLLSRRALLDSVTPVGDRYVGLTGLGSVETRNLGVRLYRVSDTDFGTYWAQSQKISQDLTDLAAGRRRLRCPARAGDPRCRALPPLGDRDRSREGPARFGAGLGDVRERLQPGPRPFR